MKGNVKFAISHPTGNTFVRALLEELHKKGLLSVFYTTIGFSDESRFFSNIFMRRTYSIPNAYITRQWMPEVKRLLLPRKQETRQKLTDKSYFCLDKKVAKLLDEKKVQFLHAYEDGAANSFSNAKKNGIHCS